MLSQPGALPASTLTPGSVPPIGPPGVAGAAGPPGAAGPARAAGPMGPAGPASGSPGADPSSSSSQAGQFPPGGIPTLARLPSPPAPDPNAALQQTVANLQLSLVETERARAMPRQI